MKSDTSKVVAGFVSLPDLAPLCRRWKVAELSIFGSAIGEAFTASSDIDLLVQFLDDARPTLLDLGRMQEEFEAALGRTVDLVSKRGVLASRNRIRRESILSTARVLYAA